MIPLCMSAWMPTDDARAFAADVALAIDAVMPRKAAADLMGIREAQLSEWLACLRPLNAFRLTSLPESFWHRLLELRAARFDGVYLKPDVVSLLRGAATVRRMAKASHAAQPQKRSA